MSQRVESAKVLVAAAKTKQKDDFDHILPDPHSIRYAHQVASCFIEGKIGEEMVRHSKISDARWNKSVQSWKNGWVCCPYKR